MKRKSFFSAKTLLLVGAMTLGLASCGTPAEEPTPTEDAGNVNTADVVIAEGVGHTEHGYELDVLLQEYESGKVQLYLAFHGGGQGGGHYIEYTGTIEKGVDEDGDGLVSLTLESEPSRVSYEESRETMSYNYGVQTTNTYDPETGAYSIPVQLSMFGYADLSATIDVATVTTPTDVEAWYEQYGLGENAEQDANSGNDDTQNNGEESGLVFFGGADDFGDQGGTAAQIVLKDDGTAFAQIGYASPAGTFYASYLEENGTWSNENGQYVVTFTTKIVDGEETAIEESFTSENGSILFTATKFSTEKQQDEAYEVLVTCENIGGDALLTIAGTYTTIELYSNGTYKFEFPDMVSENGSWSWDSTSFVLTLTTEGGLEYTSQINGETYALEFTFTADAGGGQLSDTFSSPRADWGPVLNPA